MVKVSPGESLYAREHAHPGRRTWHGEGQLPENRRIRQDTHKLQGEHSTGRVGSRQIAIYARTRTDWKENIARRRSALGESLYTREHAHPGRRASHGEGQPSANRCIRQNTHNLEGEHGTGRVGPRRIAVYARTRTYWKENIARGMSALSESLYTRKHAHPGRT